MALRVQSSNVDLRTVLPLIQETRAGMLIFPLNNCKFQVHTQIHLKTPGKQIESCTGCIIK